MTRKITIQSVNAMFLVYLQDAVRELIVFQITITKEQINLEKFFVYKKRSNFINFYFKLTHITKLFRFKNIAYMTTPNFNSILDLLLEILDHFLSMLFLLFLQALEALFH